MKYGIVFFNKTEDLGDDIQTYAAIHHLPKIDYVIEREKLSSFVPNKNELVTVIMNGWYNHDVSALPPSPFINPLIISAHFTIHLKNIKPEYFDETFMCFLKKFQPIGLRDDLVKKYLDKENIENYFSGCLTLTIKPFKNIKVENKICVVDVDDDILEKVKKVATCNVIEETHNLNSGINSTLTFHERMMNVENQLKKYQSCKLVITSRLHVALPCLSIGVPVLLIYDEDNIDIKNRLGNYIKILNHLSKQQFMSNPDLNIKNKNDYLNIRKNLNSKVKKFLISSQKLKLDSNDDYILYKKYYSANKNRIDSINNFKISELKKNYNKLILLNRFIQLESNIKSENLIKAQSEINFLNEQIVDITSSKGYKMLELFRKIKRKLKM